MARRRVLCAVLAVAALSATAACSSVGQPSRAGPAGPLVLRLATPDAESRPGARQAAEFARQVASLSDGQLRIEITWEAVEENEDDWDQQVARAVVDGDFDLGVVPARTWDTEGVTSLQVLQAPQLVDSHAVMDRVTAGPVAAALMAGLPDAGVTGLALLPESLRYLFVHDLPADPTRLGGLVVRSPTSRMSDRVLAALGARGDDHLAGEREASHFTAFETSFALTTTLPTGLSVHGDLPLFAKVNVLVVNTAVLDRLTEQQERVVRAAAGGTRTWAARQISSEHEAARQFCRLGGRVVHAGPAVVEAVRDLWSPVTARLRSHPATATILTRVERIRERVQPEPDVVSPCAPPSAPDAAAGASAPADRPFPEGVYRTELTVTELRARGLDDVTAAEHAGIWTLTFRNGRFVDPGCPGGTYRVVGEQLVVTLGPEGESCGTLAGQELFRAGWSVDGDQLRFLDVRNDVDQLIIETVFGSEPFIRIG